MRTQINRENAGFNTTNFLKWIMQNPKIRIKKAPI